VCRAFIVGATMVAMPTEVLTPARHAALLAFLARPDQGFCFCRYWDFGGGTVAWLACDPEANRDAMARALDAGEVWGVVALDGDAVVGWMRLSRTAAVPKLADDAPGAASVLCVAVAEERRGRGLARALLRAAIEAARDARFVELRAHPRFEDGLDAGAVWTGPRRLFEAEGFVKVREGERRWTYARTLNR